MPQKAIVLRGRWSKMALNSHKRALTIRYLPILGTIIAYGVAVTAQLITMPTMSVELSGNTTEPVVLAHEEVVAPETYYEDTEAVVLEYFKDIPIMTKVAWCESRLTHINPATGTVLRGRVNSSDVGVMQINQYYHNDTAEALGLDLLQLEDNLAYARNLYEREGTQPWSASQACWQNNTLAMR